MLNLLTPKPIRPTFLIIGVQKGGTSSLHYYLQQHKKIVAPEQKEIHFFDDITEKSIDNYLQLFPKKNFHNRLSFESTPRYMYFPGTAARIHRFDPNMKFIVLLRHPVKRAYSAWNMYKQLADNPQLVSYFKTMEEDDPRQRFYSTFYDKPFPSFEKCVEEEISLQNSPHNIEPAVVRRGYYKYQIDDYLKYFDREQFLFIESEELKTDTKRVLTDITKFLKISNFNYIDLDLSIKHSREYVSSIPQETHDKLYNHYLTVNKGLEDMVGKSLKWMN